MVAVMFFFNRPRYFYVKSYKLQFESYKMQARTKISQLLQPR